MGGGLKDDSKEGFFGGNGLENQSDTVTFQRQTNIVTVFWTKYISVWGGRARAVPPYNQGLGVITPLLHVRPWHRMSKPPISKPRMEKQPPKKKVIHMCTLSLYVTYIFE